MSDDEHPHTWYTTNLVGVAAPVLGSTEFNAHPIALHIGGTREAHAGLFALLDNSRDALEASEVFVHYLSLAFGLQPAVAPTSVAEARRWRVSYLKLLQSWGLDSNGPAGAVFKGWVESRFGLVPCFHRARLERFPSGPGWPTWKRRCPAAFTTTASTSNWICCTSSVNGPCGALSPLARVRGCLCGGASRAVRSRSWPGSCGRARAAWSCG